MLESVNCREPSGLKWIGIKPISPSSQGCKRNEGSYKWEIPAIHGLGEC